MIINEYLIQQNGIVNRLNVKRICIGVEQKKHQRFESLNKEKKHN
jgi:hypothetical protein